MPLAGSKINFDFKAQDLKNSTFVKPILPDGINRKLLVTRDNYGASNYLKPRVASRLKTVLLVVVLRTGWYLELKR